MAGSTVILEIHGWRGFHIDGGPLGSVLVVGFFSVSYVPYLLSDWLKEKLAKLKNVSGNTRGFVEMGVWGEEPHKPTTPKFVQKFPNGIHKS